ncbi:MAG TPA: hypothetical protein VGP72_33270 [Planctomycetota bacterium]|jgi:hypothetical protein
MKWKYKYRRQPGCPTPREYLRFAEEWAIRVQRLLSNGDDSVPKGDASRNLALIERLARRGKNATAVEARGLAGKVERLIDLTRTELTAILSTRKQNAE